MRKITVCLLIIFLLINNYISVFASSNENFNIPCTANIESSFTVSVPKSLDLSEGNVAYDINVIGDMMSNEILNIVPNSTLEMREQNNVKPSQIVSVEQDKTTWDYIDVLNSTSTKGTLKCNKLSAGTWNGTLQFQITISEKEYDITYNLDDGILGEGYQNKYYSSIGYKLPTPIKQGYSFAGWYEFPDFSGDVLTDLKGKIGNKVLYVKWSKEINFTISQDVTADSNYFQGGSFSVEEGTTWENWIDERRAKPDFIEDYFYHSNMKSRSWGYVCLKIDRNLYYLRNNGRSVDPSNVIEETDYNFVR